MSTNLLKNTTKMVPIYWIYEGRGLKWGMAKKSSEVYGGSIHAKAQFERHTEEMDFYMKILLYSCISVNFLEGHFADHLVTMW